MSLVSESEFESSDDEWMSDGAETRCSTPLRALRIDELNFGVVYIADHIRILVQRSQEHNIDLDDVRSFLGTAHTHQQQLHEDRLDEGDGSVADRRRSIRRRNRDFDACVIWMSYLLKLNAAEQLVEHEHAKTRLRQEDCEDEDSLVAWLRSKLEWVEVCLGYVPCEIEEEE